MRGIKKLFRVFKRYQNRSTPILIAAMFLAILNVVYDNYERTAYQKEIASLDIVGDKKAIGRSGLANTSFDNITVVDGDSLRSQTADGRVINIRLYGIDAPELDQEFGKQAKKFLFERMDSEGLQALDVINVDQYGRPVVIAYFNSGQSVQEVLLQNGMAWYYGQYCTIQPECSQWKREARRAKQERRGLWENAAAKAPWNWRKQN